MSVTFEPYDPRVHVDLVHAWVTAPHARFWMMQDHDRAQVADEYAQIAASPHHDAWIGSVDGRPAFLAETYDPDRSEIAGVHDTQPGDLGMHVLVAPPTDREHGFTTRVFTAVMQHCFTLRGHGGLDTARVVVEPDVRNEAIARLNARAGFRIVRRVTLADKTAALSTCTRAHFRTSELGVATRQEVTA